MSQITSIRWVMAAREILFYFVRLLSPFHVGNSHLAELGISKTYPT
ncbi:MAG: hypothetical protein F6K40_01460 [Okeania sp. SIO3I5]|nr:hypothetical protein [Okeania sp. SIO3I5]NEQ35048.1 hypothetical protein [Okeania sp. SIO3I5]